MKAIYKRRKVKGRSIDEHRLVMEIHLGRRLKRYEVVHHIDGDKFNNNISNLQLMSHKEHSIIHNQKYPIEKKCEICGNLYTPKPTKRLRQKTCSNECRKLILRINNPSAKTTYEDRINIKRRFYEGERGVDLAKEYKISPQAISYIVNN